jgi:hypothetical protein
MKKIICVTLFLTLFASTFAQKRFELFYLGGSYNLMSGTGTNPDKNGETSFQANLSVPIVLKNKSVWYTSLDYQYFSMPNEYFPNDSVPVRQFNLHALILRTGYIWKFGDNQALHVLFAPRFMTDFKASFSKSIQPGGVIMYEKVKNDDLTWRAGVMFNRDFFGMYMLPVVYLDWRIAGKLKLTGMLPVYAKVYVQHSESFAAGIHFIGLTTSFRIFEPGYENYYVDRRSIDLSCFANKIITGNLILEGRIGYSVQRDYGLFADQEQMTLGLPLLNIGDQRIRSNNHFNNSPFGHLRLTYSIPVK